MRFDWDVNVGTLLNLLVIIATVIIAASRFDTSNRLSLQKLQNLIDLTAQRVTYIEDWMRTHNEEATGRTQLIAKLEIATAKLTTVVGMLEQRFLDSKSNRK